MWLIMAYDFVLIRSWHKWKYKVAVNINKNNKAPKSKNNVRYIIIKCFFLLLFFSFVFFLPVSSLSSSGMCLLIFDFCLLLYCYSVSGSLLAIFFFLLSLFLTLSGTLSSSRNTPLVSLSLLLFYLFIYASEIHAGLKTT